MARSTIQDRRKLRELEAKRDRLLETSTKSRSELAKIRAEIKAFKRSKR